jgi:uncharacterized Fe-S cluster protein YjdI
MDPKTQNYDFIENRCYDFNHISVICRGHVCIYSYNCVGGIFKKITILAAWIQMRNVDFVETSFIGQMDFIVFRYSGTKSGLLRNHRFRFQGYLVMVNRI